MKCFKFQYNNVVKMLTMCLVEAHIPVVVVSDIVMKYARTSNFADPRCTAKNGLYEECLYINDPHIGLIGAIEGQHEHIVKLLLHRTCNEPATQKYIWVYQKYVNELSVAHVEIACMFSNVNIVKMLIDKLYFIPDMYYVCIRNACFDGGDDVLLHMLNIVKPSRLEKYVEIVCHIQNENKLNILLACDAKYYTDINETLTNEIAKACKNGNMNIIKILHAYAKQHSYELDWNDFAGVACNVEILNYALQYGTHGYDYIFLKQCVNNMLSLKNADERLNILRPRVSTIMLNHIKRNIKNRAISKQVHQELFKRAIAYS